MNDKKLIGFEEWWGTKLPDKEGVAYAHAESAWIAAREGMIPANAAFQIPPVEKWPKRANYICLTFSDLPVNIVEKAPVYSFISRPVEAWMPKVDEAVFYKSQSGDALIGKRLSDYVGKGFVYIKLQHGSGIEVNIRADRLKPFDPSKIGLAWDEI